MRVCIQGEVDTLLTDQHIKSGGHVLPRDVVIEVTVVDFEFERDTEVFGYVCF